jgi:hypothetical protein
LKPDDTSNHRNGRGGKTVLTDDGPLSIEVPRDREGMFEPRLIGNVAKVTAWSGVKCDARVDAAAHTHHRFLGEERTPTTSTASQTKFLTLPEFRLPAFSASNSCLLTLCLPALPMLSSTTLA